MTDLEIKRLCADALGVQNKYPWNPLHDDAQAMALVKKFNLFINWNTKTECWVMPMMAEGSMFDSADHADLNRAICECVAKMFHDKHKVSQ